MSLMTNYILPANGNERLPLISILLGGVTKVIVTYVLVGNPHVNIYGAPLGTLGCYLVMLTCNLIFMARSMARPMNLWRIAGRAGVSCATMAVAVWAVWNLLSAVMGGMGGSVAGRPLSLLVPFALSVMTGVVVYFVMAIALRAITLEDMKLFPKGEIIAKKLHIR